ncbi:MAG: sensor histidine kinase [Acidobacteria bacterium]|nr:sensor histidine kinase [Acidobacteriota bacterium]
MNGITLPVPIANPVRINTRTVLAIYAVGAMLLGAALAAFGPIWFHGEVDGLPYAKNAFVRVVGAVIFAAGCFAMALARVEDPDARRRGIGWLAIGHAVVAAVVISQHFTIWIAPWSAAAGGSLFTVAGLLLYLWQFGEGSDGRLQGGMIVLFPDGDVSVPYSLRSEYERRIQQAAAQEERNRLARDLHDSIKQQLFAIHTAAATAQARFEGEPAGARAAIDQIRESARAATGEMDAMLQGLRAAPLENVGLVEALKQACEALAFRTGARVDFTPGALPSSMGLPPGTQNAIFRIAQEALANIARHARATHVQVTLAGSDGEIELTVKDDGAGFDQSQPARGVGLSNMRTRAEQHGGRIELVSQPGVGTRVRLTVRAAGRDSGDAKYHGRRAAMYGMIAFTNLMMGLATASHDRDLLMLNVPVSILMLAGCVHELLAYFHTRKPQGAGQ